MIPMVTDRRNFLSGLGMSALGLLWPWTPARAGEKETSTYLIGAVQRAPGRYAAAILEPGRDRLRFLPLPGRGHDTAIRPGTGECIMFARRPGNYALTFDPRNRTKPQLITSRPGRHFYGHGGFDPKGQLLYTTENNITEGSGRIVVRDSTDHYRWIGEFPAFGTGPHDIALLPDGKTLVVAVGGIQTHPDFPGKPLNIHEMQPSLTYVDRNTGDLIEQVTLDPDLHKLSIRHLDVAADGTVVFGCQHYGSPLVKPPLVGFHKIGQQPQMISVSRDLNRHMRNYVGSVSLNQAGNIAAVTSPRGGMALYFDVATRELIGSKRLKHVSGVAQTGDPKQFAHSATGGDLNWITPGITGDSIARSLRFKDVMWDNHLSALIDHAKG